jgi:NAD(P)H dehydrogenase (quinone)
MTLVAVTGATGRVGGRVARALAAAGIDQRLVVRDPARAPRLDRAEVAVATYADTDAVRRALEGVDIVLMVSGSESADRVEQHRSFVDGARTAGVGHVVYTSFLGAAPDAAFTLARDHWATERILAASGMAFTCLRDNFYADVMPDFVGADGAIRGPAGDGRVSLLAVDDVADVAVAVLRDPSAHRGTAYPLTGPEALSFDDVARIIGEETGRPTTYVRETVEEAYASRAVYGAQPWQVDAWVSTYTAIAGGELAEVTTAVRDLAGHPPRDLRTVLRSR